MTKLLPIETSSSRVSSSSNKSLTQKLENIDENGPVQWLPISNGAAAAAPETPTESMEFLARSWSLSAMELSKALSTTNTHHISPEAHLQMDSTTSKDSKLLSGGTGSPTVVSPRDSEEMKELFLLHQALHPELLSSQQLLRNGIYKSMLKGRTMGRWLKDQKVKKKHEIRTHKAQLHAAVSVAGVAAAVAALVTSNAQIAPANHMYASKTSAAMASATALVASHCIEIAEEMGADHDQISAVIDSAINARSKGDIMTLTAGAATALRGAAILRAGLHKIYGAPAFSLADENVEECKEASIAMALNFVAKGGELLKRTRKGDLHWKQVSFNINSNFQVAVKMRSKHMGGTFTKTKKCVINGIEDTILGWPGREKDEAGSGVERAYFGIKTAERTIEFECTSKTEKQMWIQGVQHFINITTRANLT